jgi:predicted PurR-regulated permease PerM
VTESGLPKRRSVPVNQDKPVAANPETGMAESTATAVRRRRVRSLQIWVGVAAVIVGIGVIYLIRDTLGAFVLGTLLAFLINPVVDRLSAYLPRAVAIVIIFIALVAGLVGLASVFLPLLTTEIGQLQQQTPHILAQAQHSVERMQGQPIVLFGFKIDLTRQASNLDQRGGEFLLGQFGNALTISLVALNLLLQAILTLIVAFLVSLDAHRISGFARELVPGDYRIDFDAIWPKVKAMLFSYLRGQLTVAVIIGGAVGIALAIEGMPFAVALGVLAAITSLVPFIGPWLGAVPIELVALSLGPPEAILVGLTYLVITNVVLQFLFPRILGAAVKLPALLVIIAFIAGFSLAGILGMFIAIPVAATIAILFDHVYLRIYGTQS